MEFGPSHHGFGGFAPRGRDLRAQWAREVVMVAMQGEERTSPHTPCKPNGEDGEDRIRNLQAEFDEEEGFQRIADKLRKT